jgi:hypothetical protein
LLFHPFWHNELGYVAGAYGTNEFNGFLAAFLPSEVVDEQVAPQILSILRFPNPQAAAEPSANSSAPEEPSRSQQTESFLIKGDMMHFALLQKKRECIACIKYMLKVN